MKIRCVLSCVLSLSAAALSLQAADSPQVLLRGIVAVATNKLAILENPQGNSWDSEMLLSEGQRQADVEVIKIDPAAGTVEVRCSGTTLVSRFPNEFPSEAWFVPSSGSAREPRQAGSSFRLQNVTPRAVLAIYQNLAGRTLIRSQSVPAGRLDVGCSNPNGTKDAIAAIEHALGAKGMVFQVHDGTFALLAKTNELSRITPEVKQVAARLAKARARATPDQVLPRGAINFPSTDLIQVLAIFQELINRPLLYGSALPIQMVSFHNVNPLTIEEAIYALNATLALNGISVLPADDRFVFVFPTPQRGQVDALLSRKLPVHQPVAADTPTVTVDFTASTLPQLLNSYQKLSGKPIHSDFDLPTLRMTMRSPNRLAPQDVLHGLDLLIGYNGFAVVPQEDGKGLKLVKIEK